MTNDRMTKPSSKMNAFADQVTDFHSDFVIRHSPRTGFTLIEMLLATVLAAMLMGGVLLMASTIGRDRARIAADELKPRGNAMVDQLRWDLTNAMTFAQLDNGRALILTGHGGLDAWTLSPNGRLTRVIYEIRGNGPDAALFRRQDYLDDPVRPQPWTELVALKVLSLRVLPRSGDADPVEKEKPTSLVANEDESASRRRTPQVYFVPSQAELLIQRPHSTFDTELWLR